MYRDARTLCPRCGTDLLDAKAGLACATCTGIFISGASLQEMVTYMQIPPSPRELPGEAVTRQPLPCPHCTEPMQTLVILEVAVDACGKHHGMWFDVHELALVLLRSARRPA
jgi:Zn-finger nucleic acid-binding protein